YDVLLLDNRLPDMDAGNILKALLAQNAPPPVVVVTAVGDEDLVIRVVRLGAWDYVPKTKDYVERLPDLLRNTLADYRRRPNHHHNAARLPQRGILYVERHEADID